MEAIVLLNALKGVVTRSVASEGKAAVAYSGGLDSSLIAKLASDSAEVICYSCVTEGSYDAKRVLGQGKADGLEVRMLTIADEDMPSLVSRTANAICSTDPVKISYSIPAVAVLARCSESLVLAGNGADELFAGYSKYVLRPSEYESNMKNDLRKSLEEAERLKIFARSLGKRAFFPYLTDEIVTVGCDIPLEQKMSRGSRKAILCEAGRIAGLSAADRPKKAAQYSSGTLKMMRGLAKSSNLALSQWTLDVISAQTLDKD